MAKKIIYKPTITLGLILSALLLLYGLGEVFSRISASSYSSGAVAQPGSYSVPSQETTVDPDWRTVEIVLNQRLAKIAFPFYSQDNPGYKDVLYGKNSEGKATIGTSGCGPAAAAMILRFLGKNVDPAIIAAFSLDSGYRIDDQGTSPKLFYALAERYGTLYYSTGLHGESQDEKWQKVRTWLLNGWPVIASMNDHDFSAGGHYIVLNGLNKDGEVVISDPKHPEKVFVSQNQVKAYLSHAHLLLKNPKK